MCERKIKIHNQIKEQNLRYNYEVRDIREFDCSQLIESDDIKDNIMAILCDIKDIDRFLIKLQEKLSNLENKKKQDYLRKFFYLARLRPKLYDIIELKKEELAMPFIIEKESDPLYRDGLRKGAERGLEKLKQEIKKGREEGLQRGIQKGKKEATKETKLAIAKAMLEQNIPIDVISKTTGLSNKKIENL